MPKSNYNLVPKLRCTGEKYLLLWNTQWEQNHIVIANSMKQINQIWKTIVKKYGLEAEPRRLTRASIVLPPEWACEKYANDCYDDELYSFKTIVMFDIQRYFDDYNKMPPNVEKCNNFVRDNIEREFVQDEYWDKISDEKHNSCINCFNGIRLLKNTWEELFEKDPDNQDMPFIPFDGIKASPDKSIYVCSSDFGHHHEGIRIDDIEKDQKFSFGKDRVLFFFHGEELVMTEEILNSLEVLKEEERIKEEQRIIKLKERQKEREKEQYTSLLKILE